MLQKVKLKNFQGHKETEINLSPGLNTIIGTSDHGKSSVIRAIRWVNENKPTGTGFVSHWAYDKKGKKIDDPCECELLTTDEHTVVRKRGEKENKYFVDGADLGAFGTNPPDSVAEVLQISEINFQKQEDSFFLINATSGETMRKINSFVDLDIIDQMFKAADSDMRSVKSSLKHHKATLEETERKLEPYAVLDTLEELCKSSEETETSIASMQTKLDDLRAKVQSIHSIDDRLSQIGDIDNVLSLIDSSVEKSEEIKNLRSEKNDIQNTIDRINSLDKSMPEIPKSVERLLTKSFDIVKSIESSESMINELEVIIEQYHRHEFNLENTTLADVNIDDVIELQEAIKEKKSKLKEMRVMIDKFTNVQKRFRDTKKYIRKTDADFKKLMPDVCPLCGSAVGEGHSH